MDRRIFFKVSLLAIFLGLFVWPYAVRSDSSFNDLKIGSQAPDFTLRDYSPLAREVQLSSFKGNKVVLLQFGSSTAWPYVKVIGDVNKLAQRYRGKAEFLTVYTKEADKDWQPQNYFERFERAKGLQFAYVLQSRQRIFSSILIDDLDDKVAKAYGGLPAAVFLVDKDGAIAYKAEEIDTKQIREIGGLLEKLTK